LIHTVAAAAGLAQMGKAGTEVTIFLSVLMILGAVVAVLMEVEMGKQAL
jgi:hypothetical protein